VTGKVDEWIHLFAAPETKRRTTREKERSVGSDTGRDFAQQ
jgi:hypothetical protein